MKFSRLSEYFAEIEGTSLRNKKTEILAEIFREADSTEIDKLVYLALGGLRPQFDRLEFNLAEKMIIRALGQAMKVPIQEMATKYQQVGDLGELVSQIIGQSDNLESQRVRESESQTVSQVYGELEKIAQDSGTGSQERKVGALAKLIERCGGIDAKYIVRMVAGKLRLGFSDKTVLDALSYMESGTKQDSERLNQAYQVRPDPGYLAKMVKEYGIESAVAKTDVVIGTPIVPALAQRLKTAKEMIEKMGKVIVEPKMDGTRVQIHFSRNKPKGSELGYQKFGTIVRGAEFQTGLFGAEEKLQFWVRTFTRNLDESSEMFPELQSIAQQIKAEEVILDSEAVGYDPKTGKLVPFQLTITRKRKHGVGEAQASVPLKFFVFDIMYLNGESLIHLPLRERRKILSEVIQNHKGFELGSRKFGTMMGQGSELRGSSEPWESMGPLVVDDCIETDDPDVLREYHKKQLADGLEGALVKQIDGQYMPGRTGFNWVKFKEAEDSRAKLSDTIDVVIMGYYLGKGKRSNFGLGAFLVGIRGNNQAQNPNNQTNSKEKKSEIQNEDMILTLAKVGTGITDAVFGELGERLESIQIQNPKIQISNKLKILNSNNQTLVVPDVLEPDVWVEPKIVVEVAADEITMSPTHSAGYALRFPRLVRFRQDKGVEQVTTLDEIKTMYEQH